jgi:hypothetical protein
MSFPTIFIITIFMLAIVFVSIGVKILLKKDGEFAGTCASQSPFLNKEGESCSLCGAKAEEKCKNEEA